MTRIANFLEVLNFYEDADHNVKIKLGNHAFAFEGLAINADYMTILTNFFKSGLERVNFVDSIGTSKVINGYVKNVTEGLIDEIVQPSNFNSDTRLILDI